MEEKFIYTEKRPWGSFTTVFADKDCKVKQITVEPKQKLSYQSHDKREENWYIISGEAKVVLEGKNIFLKSGDTIKIGLKEKHRIENTGDKKLKFIEIQTGEYFGEDDIVRYEDLYGRTD